MKFPELSVLLKDSAPLIADALTGNYSALALSLVQNMFGGKTPQETANIITDDPMSAFKLKNLDDTHAEALKKLSDIDTQSARTLVDVEPLRKDFVIILVILLSINIISMIFVKDTQLKHFLYISAGALVAELRQVCKLYFGS